MDPLVIANWKMYPQSLADARKLFDATKAASDKARSVSVVVAPPAIFLHDLRARYKGKKIAFAVQNAHAEREGAHTGEISLVQAQDAGASWVIVGHAERRAMGETDADVRAKTAAALALRMTPIICVGELSRGNSGDYFAVVKEQLRVALADVPPTKLSKLVIAYEPVWAIGATAAMSSHQMHEMAIFIRKTLFEIYGKPGMSVQILYGGSIDETNAPDMIQNGDIQGLLVGRASTDAQKFAALIKSIA